MNLLDSVVGEQFFVPDVLGDEESRTLTSILVVSLFDFGAREAHLRVTWRREHVLGLSLSGELLGKDLALNIRVWANVRDG